MLAVTQSLGRIPWPIEREGWNNLVRGGARKLAPFCNKEAGIWSGPQALSRWWLESCVISPREIIIIIYRYFTRSIYAPRSRVEGQSSTSLSLSAYPTLAVTTSPSEDKTIGMKSIRASLSHTDRIRTWSFSINAHRHQCDFINCMRMEPMVYGVVFGTPCPSWLY